MSSWVWWRPVVVGAASTFDLAARTISDSRDALRSEGAFRRVWAGQLGMFALTALCLAVGVTAILRGVPEVGLVALLGPLSAPSLSVLARSVAAPSRSRLLAHLFGVLGVASLATGFICFFDAGRPVSAFVLWGGALLLGVAALFLRRRYRSAPPAPPASPVSAQRSADVAGYLALLADRDPVELERLRREAWGSPPE